MDKKIVATPIPPDPPEASRLVIRITGIGLLAGILAIIGGCFWPVVGPWLVAAGTITVTVAFSLLAPYWRPSVDQSKRDDRRKLYERQ